MENDKRKVLTVTMNPCFDRTIHVDKVEHGGTHRPESVQNDVGGKGINVSTVLTHFGEPTVCLGFCYSADGNIVEKALDDRGIPHDFVIVDGRTRTNIKIHEKESGVMTEFNEKGSHVGSEKQQQLIECIDSYLDQAGVIVLDGSVPEGVPTDSYEQMIRMANGRGVKTILDASGELLAKGVRAVPYLIKPNISEFCETFGIKTDDESKILEKAREIAESGITYICISMGNAGAYLVSRETILYAEPMQVEVRGIQGAGDSMVAGFCLALNRELSMREMFACGVAAASGSLRHPGTKLCTKEELEELLPQVVIREVARY